MILDGVLRFLRPGKVGRVKIAVSLVVVPVGLASLSIVANQWWGYALSAALGLSFVSIALWIAIVSLSDRAAQEARDLWGLSGFFSDQPLPGPGGWALGADALLYILRHNASDPFTRALELGPGTSSLVLGASLKSCEMTGLEHDPSYVRSVDGLLRGQGIENYSLLHAPLTTVPGTDTQWYDSTIVSKLPLDFDLIIVDGPPNLGGRGAREPAIELIRENARQHALIIVDDTDRPDERRMAAAWVSEGIVEVADDYGSFIALRRL